LAQSEQSAHSTKGCLNDMLIAWKKLKNDT